MSESMKKETIIKARVEKVFALMDDLSKTGMHVSEGSVMMMGSKLELERLPGPEKGFGATYRWRGGRHWRKTRTTVHICSLNT